LFRSGGNNIRHPEKRCLYREAVSNRLAFKFILMLGQSETFRNPVDRGTNHKSLGTEGSPGAVPQLMWMPGEEMFLTD